MRWVRYFLLIVCILFCSCHVNQTAPIKNSDRLRVVKQLYEIYYEKELAAEVQYQKYLLGIADEE